MKPLRLRTHSSPPVCFWGRGWSLLHQSFRLGFGGAQSGVLGDVLAGRCVFKGQTKSVFFAWFFCSTYHHQKMKPFVGSKKGKTVSRTRITWVCFVTPRVNRLLLTTTEPTLTWFKHQILKGTPNWWKNLSSCPQKEKNTTFFGGRMKEPP